MDRLQALKELLLRVEVGKKSLNTIPHWSKQNMFDALRAANGSLDAAKALHDAVLGGWTWQKMPDGTIHLMCQETFDTSLGHTNNNPARAWLIAIIKALITQEEVK